jgi:hypothetical protein
MFDYMRHWKFYQFDSSCIKPINTFPFLKDFVFKMGIGFCFPEEEEHIIAENSTEIIAKDYEEANIDHYHFEAGIYKYLLPDSARFEIELNEDKKYELRCKEEFKSYFPEYIFLKMDYLFSLGTWERKGNVLYLWDTNLEHQFYGLIRENGIELLFNREWKDLVFKKE